MTDSCKTRLEYSMLLFVCMLSIWFNILWFMIVPILIALIILIANKRAERPTIREAVKTGMRLR